jgi:uncharacterized membrane protein
MIFNFLIFRLFILEGNLALVDPLHTIIGPTDKTKTKIQRSAQYQLLQIRLITGQFIALALTILVAADILETVVKPGHAYELVEMVKMAFITVIRTGIAYFLGLENKELEEEQEHLTHHASGHGHGHGSGDHGHGHAAAAAHHDDHQTETHHSTTTAHEDEGGEEDHHHHQVTSESEKEEGDHDQAHDDAASEQQQLSDDNSTTLRKRGGKKH